MNGYRQIAAGNANTLIRRPDGSLIRVSKSGKDPYAIADYWNAFWKPKLNGFLCNITPTVDSYHGTVLLIDEIGNSREQKKIVAEFKPKWLTQSPEAPEGAKSCRTCAIKTMRHQPLHWCSLDFKEKTEDCIQALTNSSSCHPDHRDGVAKLLHNSEIIDRLAYWQINLSSDLHNCMTLRDCTVLIEYHATSGTYAAWIVDLDPKFGEAKLEKWKHIEKCLAPYYLKTSKVCRLSREQ